MSHNELRQLHLLYSQEKDYSEIRYVEVGFVLKLWNSHKYIQCQNVSKAVKHTHAQSEFISAGYQNTSGFFAVREQPDYTNTVLLYFLIFIQDFPFRIRTFNINEVFLFHRLAYIWKCSIHYMESNVNLLWFS